MRLDFTPRRLFFPTQVTILNLTPEQAEKLAENQSKFNEELNKTEGLLEDIGKNLDKDIQTSLKSAIKNANKLNVEFGTGLDVSRKLARQQLDLSAKIETIERKLRRTRSDAAVEKLKYEMAIYQRLQSQLYKTEQILEEEKKITEEKKKQDTISGFLKNKWNDLSKSFSRAAILTLIFKSLVDAGIRLSKVSTDISKNLGYGVDNANRTTKELIKAAQSSDNLNFTLQNAADAANEISTATGYVAEYSVDALGTQIMLTKQFGLTADEAAGIYKFSVLTGKSSKAVNDAMVGAFVATRNNLKVGAPFKATIAEAAKISGQLAANLQNNPAAIVKAVVQAKALGTTLEQTKKQSESLLDFQSSIENELKAELLTGRELNLERARAAALTGDQVTLAQELNKNVGTLEEFQQMNVLQQKSIAEAVGLTADELANQLRQQKIAKETGKSLAQITKDEALEAQKRQDIQTKFNQAILKLQDLIGNLVSGPMAAFIEGLSRALDIVGKIFSKFGSFVELIKGILPSGLSKAIGGLASIATVGALTAVIARSLTKGTVGNPMITKDFSAAGTGGSLTDMIFGKKAGGQIKKGGGRVPKGGRTGGFLKGAGGKSLLGILGGVGLDYASEAAAGAGNEGLAKGLSVGSGILSGAGTGALLGSIIPGVGTAIGGVAGGIIGGLGSLFADDMVGYGARTLITPTGNVALNNNDTVIAGTNLFKGDDVMSFPKGALNVGGDMSELIKVVKEALNRPSVAYIPEGREAFSKQIATSAVQGSYKAA